MKIFFSMRHLGSFRMYEPTIREMAGRGHHLHLALGRAEALGWEKALHTLIADHPAITWTWLSPTASSFWSEVAKTIRLWADYLRYFQPQYDSTPKLKARAEERVPPRLVRLTNRPAFQKPANRRRLLSVLRTLERALPPVPEIEEQLRAERPDMVLITPLVYLGSSQFEVLRTSLSMGLRTVFCVGSWDHLSSKALIRDMPQRVLVWNDTQRDEAIQLHGVPADRVVVTGAQCYDQWFGRLPVRSREEFSRRVGLPADRPFILYVCSALFWGSPIEAEFVRRWVQSLRESAHPKLRNAAVLIRPHPARMDEWNTVDLSAFEGVTLYGSNPVDAASKDDYFESLYYSGAVVGLNTSAFLEAAVVGRPVHTIMPPVYFDNQEGTLHFHYLLHVGGGLLRPARSFEEHMGQLDDTLAGSHPGNEGFVRAFIRPHGLDVPATATFVDAVEQLAAVPAPAPAPIRLGARLLRVPLFPLALLARVTLGDDQDAVDRTTREIRREHERAKKARLLDEHKLRKVHAAESFEQERERRKAAVLREREDQRRARLAARERQQRERERQHAETEREKLLLKARKARDKEARLKRKRRVAWRQRLMERLGLA